MYLNEGAYFTFTTPISISSIYNDLMQQNQVIKTPCVSICKYNKANYCIGCKRHSSEITGWINYSDAVRQAIMQDLKDRDIDA